MLNTSPMGVLVGQPLDVGYNKPLKNEIRQKWEEYMIDEGLDLDVTKPPTRNVVTKWCIDSMKEIPNSVLKNCWLLTGYSYFPNEKKHATPAMETETN